jgi:hypothetical protein
MFRRLAVVAVLGVACSTPVLADSVSVLFVGNSYTFGRVDPVMSYNAENVRDLTRPGQPGRPSFDNTSGSNVFEPHPWGGVPGIFKQLTEQAGLEYDVAISARNAASLRGHMLNTNPADWDLRGNIALQPWDKVVLQEQSDEPLSVRSGLPSNPARFNNYTNKIAEYVKKGTLATYRERDYYEGANNTEKTNNCVAISGASSTSCNAQRGTAASLSSTFRLPVNPNASASTEVFLYQTWARPNLVAGAFVTITDEITGEVTRTATPATTYFDDLESMTDELAVSYEEAFQRPLDDGSVGFTDIAPVGEAFMRAVTEGVATRDMWAADATTDGLIDLWFDDGTHASKYGSYLSALVLFGTLTGIDPWSFGANEQAAADLGISPHDAVKLQKVASDQLYESGVPLIRLPCLHANPRASGAARNHEGITACGQGKP